MSDAFELEEIGVWSELKLEIVEQYGAAYTKAFNNTPVAKKYYIDGFSGAGLHKSKATRAVVDGSPARALRVSPSFDGYYFIDLDGVAAAALGKYTVSTLGKGSLAYVLA